MPTATYTDLAFFLIDLGLGCIKLDLSTGDNKFDLSRLDNPKDFCGQLPQDVRNKIHAVLDPILIHIPDFRVPGGRVRLNHLGKESAIVSWQAAQGGSILLTIEFESAGEELLGTYHGQINNGKLFVYLKPVADLSGHLVATPFTSFSADINIIGLADEIERTLGIRSKIRKQIAEKTRDELASYAFDLTETLITSLNEGSQPVPPAGAFYTKIEIGNGHATISWAETVRYAEIEIMSVQPNMAEEDERLILRLGGGPFTISRTADPNSQITLPMKLSGIPLPDGQLLNARVSMNSIDLSNPSHPTGKTVGMINRIFSSPSYGAGTHTESDGKVTVKYRIAVT